MAKTNSDIAQYVIKQCGQLKEDRGNWESHWQEIAERVWPEQSRLFAGQKEGRNQGDKRHDKVFDSTAAKALDRFGAILDSLLTPRNQTWHRLVPDEPILARDHQVREYFDEVNRISFKFRYAPLANYAAQNQLVYKMLGAYGSGALFIDSLVGAKGLRYRMVHLSELYFRENHQGLVDSAVREFELSARQAVQWWGEKALPRHIVEKATTHPDTKFKFYHMVEPRADVDPKRRDAKGMPFASYYVSDIEQHLVSEGGYRKFPYAISRYEQVPGEAYGRSPAMAVLPSIKTLNEEKKTVLKQGQRATDPVLLAHDDGIAGFSLRPGALNFGGVSAEGRPLVHTLPVGNISIGLELMELERNDINDAFLITLFQILVESPQMTATEVLERAKEKGILLAPSIGRQQSEYLGPKVERELDLLAEQGLIPPPPPVLLEAGGEYRIEYDSPMSRSQRAEEASGFLRTVETALNIAGQTGDASVLDHFDFDKIIPELADIQGVPARWLASKDKVEKVRAARQAAAEQQRAIEAAPGAAAMTNAMARAEQTQAG